MTDFPPNRYLPEFQLPDDWRRYCRGGCALPEDAGRFQFLGELAQAGAVRRYGEAEAEADRVQRRLAHELAVVGEVNYGDYFLIVWDIVREAAARDIPTLARGSAADSLLCYCLGISNVCPLRFNLYFERFLNKERMQFSKLADIDLDFPWDQREEMVDYVFEKYGEAHVAMIGGFNRFHGRAAVADIGKVFGLSESEVRYFTKRMPHVSARSILAAMDESVTARDLPRDEEPYPEIIEMARHFEGFPRHAMMHPCGIVISKVPLCRLMPLRPSGRGPQMTEYDMDAVEDMGLIKIDLLGQAGLSVLRDVVAGVRKLHGDTIELEQISWDDEPTWDMIAAGGARGVHHIESPAMTSLLVQSNCRDMDCLCAIVSVIRPGAADESKKLAFTRRHQGFEATEYPHPSLEPYLSDTYGLLVYEEHILMVAHHFAGMNLGRADVLRRELVKMKNPDLLVELGKEFCALAVASGRSDEDTRAVWEKLVHFHGYMFNKAHSAAYAVEAFQGAYLKARYPALYMAAVLTHRHGFYSPLFYVMECRRLGVRLLAPCVNRSREYFAVEEDGIRVPLSGIRGLGRKVVERWYSERARGAFGDLADFLCRVEPGEEEMRLLVDSGALDGWGETRTQIFWQARQLVSSGHGAACESGGLFSALAARAPIIVPQGLDEPSVEQRIKREVELLGFPVSGDIFDAFGPGVYWESYCTTVATRQFHGQRVQVCGVVVQTRTNRTLKGDLMQFFTLADRDGYIEVTVFPKVYRRCGFQVRVNEVIAVDAMVQSFDNKMGQVLDVLAVRKPRVVGGI